MNVEGELIASGPCEVNRERGEVTMWPSWELHMLERERHALTLHLDDGTVLDISNRHLTFKLRGPSEQRISVYRLRIAEQVPEHLAAAYAAPEPANDTSSEPEIPAQAEDIRAGHAH